MAEKDWIQIINEQNMIQKIVSTNQFTERFGLTLSEDEAQLLVTERKNSLREQGRVEFGGGILEKLIFQFCDSPYIRQDNYVETIERLQDIFYLYKNESLDELSDDELLEYMQAEFNGACAGDLDLLEDTALEDFARRIRAQTGKYIGRSRREDDI
ncbi:MAG: DUF6323 family protein [Wujia sp.]